MNFVFDNLPVKVETQQQCGQYNSHHFQLPCYFFKVEHFFINYKTVLVFYLFKEVQKLVSLNEATSDSPKEFRFKSKIDQIATVPLICLQI